MNRCSNALRGAARGLFALGLALVAMPAAGAPVVVFHSPGDDGLPPPAPVEIPTGSSETLHLYMQTGPTVSTVGTPCVDGDGDEVCAVDVVVERAGGTSFGSFAPVGDVVFAFTPTQLRFNTGAPLTGQLGVVKLGDLVVDTTTPGSVELTSGASVAANLALEAIVPATVATVVPEPSSVLGLLAGAGFLAVVRRRRTASQGVGRHAGGRRAAAV